MWRHAEQGESQARFLQAEIHGSVVISLRVSCLFEPGVPRERTVEMEGAGLGDVCRKGSPQIGCPLDFFKQKKTQRTTEHSGTLTNHVEYTVFPGVRSKVGKV